MFANAGNAQGYSVVALLVLGTNAWVSGVGWTLLRADVGMTDALIAASALLLLLIGALLVARFDSATTRVFARWLLLCAYPVGLAAVLCVGSEAARERMHSEFSLLLAGLSLIAYAAAASIACREPLVLIAVTTRNRKASLPPHRERTARRIAVMLLLLGALALALVAPLLPAYSEVEAALGPAAEAGAVLAALVGGALAVSVVALHLGSLLQPRTAEPIQSARQRRTRIATFLFLALFGSVVFFTVVH